MNTRQKAKHFKRLYEQTLPVKQGPTIYKTIMPRHKRVGVLIDKEVVAHLSSKPGLLKEHIENKILQEIRPLIWDNLEVEKDEYRYSYKFLLDIYLNQKGVGI